LVNSGGSGGPLLGGKDGSLLWVNPLAKHSVKAR
jgi:hypothetical protein